MVYVWSIMGSILAIGCEVLFKTRGEYGRFMWVLIPASIAINYCVFKIVTSTPTLVAALVIFSFTNLILRVVLNTWIISSPIGTGTWVAAGLMGAANIVRYVWK